MYYYAEAETAHTTYPDGLQLFEFPNGQVSAASLPRRLLRAAHVVRQVEKHHPSGVKEIMFEDGTTKTILATGEERSVFPDGTQVIESPKGGRTVIGADGTIMHDQ